MRGGGGYGGGFGGMLGGQRGLQSGGMNSPTMDNLTDEGVVGSAYDHKVVMRLSTYVKPYKKDAFLSILAVIVYTAANVAIPLMLMLGINRYINTGKFRRPSSDRRWVFDYNPYTLCLQLHPVRLHAVGWAGDFIYPAHPDV